MESDIAERILQEIKQLHPRFERMEAQIARLDERVEKLDEREGSGLGARFAVLEMRLFSLAKRMAKIEEVVAALNFEIQTWPEMQHLFVWTKMQLENARQTKLEIIDVKARLGEIFQSMATDPEIKVLRKDLTRTRGQNMNFERRLGAIEAKLGMRADAEQPHL